MILMISFASKDAGSWSQLFYFPLLFVILYKGVQGLYSVIKIRLEEVEKGGCIAPNIITLKIPPESEIIIQRS